VAEAVIAMANALEAVTLVKEDVVDAEADATKT
jgi:hypothetical protein